MNDRNPIGGRDRYSLLAEAASPRCATVGDIEDLSELFAAAFLNDPVFDWIARKGSSRGPGLRRFFRWLLAVRAIPYGEVWMARGVAAIWLPPGAPATAGGLVHQIRLFPMFLDLCGFSRLLRGQAIADAMEKHHPRAPHFYLAFIGVEPRLQGMGLGSALLEGTLRRVDATSLPAYLENSNSRNTRLYARYGFAAGTNIAPRGAPPVIAMWRPQAGNRNRDSAAGQGSRTLSQ
ncbi:MAG TPA: GNAT family N-acetyltransferase [Rhizomicrobium sp.]|jgi:ribosomal protein S18 acetylase RimI-like enzyme